MTVLVKFQIEIRFYIGLHGEFKIVDDVMSTIVWLSWTLDLVAVYLLLRMAEG